MSVSPSFRTFALEQLGRNVSRIRARSMFGGVGIYAGELFFALIAEDAVYFKVDDSTRGDFEARGMGPFRPYGEDGETMGYYQVPEDLLEDPDELGRWAEKAIEVARRAKKRTRS
jgi:DNA transformation protein